MNLFLIIRYSWPALVLASILAMSGCGGGSEGTGTGTERVVSGSVRSLDDLPVTDATVTILETGDSTVTDEAGNFQIQAATLPETILIEVESGDLTAQSTVANFDDQTEAIQVIVTVDSEDPEPSVQPASNISVWSRIVGACRNNFLNGLVIRQNTPINGSTTCTMKFFASGDGKKLERLPAEMQVRACGSTEWTTLAQGRTGFGINAGVGQIPFTFIDDPEHCEYRLAAPINSSISEPIFIYVSTFSLEDEEDEGVVVVD